MTPQITLGFGNNIDYEIVWDSATITELALHYRICADELDIHHAIQTERDLVISILAFLKRETGGERFVASSDIIEQFAARFAKRVTLGGTSVRAAIAMQKLGYTSALHLVTLNDHVRRLLPPDTPYVCSSAQDSSYPHLIVQFGRDTRIHAGDIHITTRQANRLIYHCDTDNIQMALNSDFADLMTGAKVLLVSGFNAMQDQTLLAQRLQTVLMMMQRLPADAQVFCEDAGFYNPAFRQFIYQTLAERINIFSLNEDELQSYLDTKIDLLDVPQVTDALHKLKRLFPIPVIVVHTQHWALAYGNDAERLQGALKSAVTMATTRYCYGDDFTADDYHAVQRLPPKAEIAAFTDSINAQLGAGVFCIPVAHVEPPVATTIGLGDSFVGGFLPALLG
jgi:ADP-dependent phosphofructokinase/glucokinase